MKNIPEVKLGLIAVSRDCFPIELSQKRRETIAQLCSKEKLPVTPLQTIVENEKDVLKALDEAKNRNINALIIYLGNFGPEGPLSLLGQRFNGPVMYVAAAEEKSKGLIDERGDAYCGMLNASYNIGLRNMRPHIPHYPVGTAEEITEMIKDFIPIARIIEGVKNLKILAYGPRPHDFYACNAPLKPLMDLGVEVMENSELDLYKAFSEHNTDPRIPEIVKEMEAELGEGNRHPTILPTLAQYEVTLTDLYKENLGGSQFALFANKCWPAFEPQFGFVPCYINSRFAGQGIPIACETDLYGALSEYMAMCATLHPSTLLDINNTVPADMYKSGDPSLKTYKPTDLFMGFHCGNTASSCMSNCSMKHQKIMHSLMEPDKEPHITRGTLEGTIKPGNITIFRLQGGSDSQLSSYAAEGEILPIDPQTFGSTGVFGIREMGRFYRYVLIENQFPHHTAVAFGHAGSTLFSAVKMLGVETFFYNQPKEALYKGENPFT